MQQRRKNTHKIKFYLELPTEQTGPNVSPVLFFFLV